MNWKRRRMAVSFLLCLSGLLAPEEMLPAAENEAAWRFLGLEGRVVRTLRLHEGYLYAATDNGLYKKNVLDADTAWTPIGLEERQVRALLVLSADTLLASTEFDTVSLYRTVDGGAAWGPFQNGFGGESNEAVYALARHPRDPDILFATGPASVGKSTDLGESWGLSHGSWQGFATGIGFITLDEADPDILWAGGQDAIERPVFLKSEDGGETWREWEDIVDDVSTVKTVSIHPENSDIVYAGLESYILKTEDGGDTWEELRMEDGRFFFGLAINPEHPERMYSASWFKTSDPQPLHVYVSDDGGESWETITESGAQYGGVWDMIYVHEANLDRLYLGLQHGGVYEFTYDLPTPVDDAPAVPAGFVLGANYPNPFNPETTIRFTLPHAVEIEMAVYNLLGQKVRTLLSGRYGEGGHAAVWDGRNDAGRSVASGVYLYRLRAGGFIATQKMLLMK